MHHYHLTADLTKPTATEGHSTREIEGVLGVGHSTIARDVANATGTRAGAKGEPATDVANATRDRT